jgi:hypothetical protein
VSDSQLDVSHSLIQQKRFSGGAKVTNFLSQKTFYPKGFFILDKLRSSRLKDSNEDFFVETIGVLKIRYHYLFEGFSATESYYY